MSRECASRVSLSIYHKFPHTVCMHVFILPDSSHFLLLGLSVCMYTHLYTNYTLRIICLLQNTYILCTIMTTKSN